jgi:hypothetical protein
MTLQQFRMQASLSLGALYKFIFCSSFCASCIKSGEQALAKLHLHEVS